MQQGHALFAAPLDGDALALDIAAKDGEAAVDLLGQVRRLRLEAERSGFDARHVQKLGQYAQQVRGAVVDIAHISPVAVVADGAEQFVPHDLREADDGVERRAQLVAHVREELRLRVVGRVRLDPKGVLPLEGSAAAMHLQHQHAGREHAHQDEGADRDEGARLALFHPREEAVVPRAQMHREGEIVHRPPMGRERLRYGPEGGGVRVLQCQNGRVVALERCLKRLHGRHGVRNLAQPGGLDPLEGDRQATPQDIESPLDLGGLNARIRETVPVELAREAQDLELDLVDDPGV